jgi:hypothetical protein
MDSALAALPADSAQAVLWKVVDRLARRHLSNFGRKLGLRPEQIEDTIQAGFQKILRLQKEFQPLERVDEMLA